MSAAQRMADSCEGSRRMVRRCLHWRVVNAANDNRRAGKGVA